MRMMWALYLGIVVITPQTVLAFSPGEECSGNGVLNNDVCHCFFGYAGENCECLACPNNCSGNGACDCDGCTCDLGWSGPACACTEVPCALGCSGSGECLCGACACDAGWTGATCNMAVAERVRAFMAPPGQQQIVTMTGNTAVIMDPGTTAHINLWLEDTAQSQELNFYQAIVRWLGVAGVGATGVVQYVDVEVGPFGDSVIVDPLHEGFVFGAEAFGPFFYNETAPPPAKTSGFGLIANIQDLATGITVGGMRYIGEFDITASEDASGVHTICWVPIGGHPAAGTTFGQPGGLLPFDVDEFQCLDVGVGGGLLVIVESEPPNGSVAAGYVIDPETGLPIGGDRVELEMAGDIGALVSDDFEVLSSAEEPPVINDVAVDGTTVSLQFDEPLPLGHCTLIRHLASGTQVRLKALPGDINGDEQTNTADLLDLIDHLGGHLDPPLELHQCDVNRSGACTPVDILAQIDLFNGAGGGPVWFNATVAPCPE